MRQPEWIGLHEVDFRALVNEWAQQCGKRVRSRRLDVGYDRRQLAGITGTTEPTIQRIEHGHINPRDHLRWMISAALVSNVSDLWCYPSYQRIRDLLDADT